MADATVEALLIDLLEWIDTRPRRYADVIEAWSSWCPRFPVWEEATDRGLVKRVRAEGEATMVALTPSGTRALRARRLSGAAPISAS
jgi:hypothetical protein